MKDFEILYETYFNDVYRYILRLSQDTAVAEEITSDTFFKAMHSIDSFRGECDVRVWLCGIAKNCYLSFIKKRNRTQSVDAEILLTVPDTSESIEDEISNREDAERIRRILHSLNEPYREVFMWRVYAELSFKQIGAMFGKTDNWACVTYHRAKKMIKEELEDKKDEN